MLGFIGVEVKKFQIDEVELTWKGFLVDADAAAASPFFDRATLASAHEDPDIVQQAWQMKRTIVTCNRRDFLRYIQQFQNRENQQECRDLWGLLVIPNLHLLRERGLSFIRHGLPQLPKVGRLGWPGIALLNLYVRLNTSQDQRPEIRRFERCSFCERDLPIREPWNGWYRSLPLVGGASNAPAKVLERGKHGAGRQGIIGH